MELLLDSSEIDLIDTRTAIFCVFSSPIRSLQILKVQPCSQPFLFDPFKNALFVLFHLSLKLVNPCGESDRLIVHLRVVKNG